MAFSTAEACNWWVNSDADGMPCGIGRPNTLISATGTPTSSPISAATAAAPVSASAGVRRRLPDRAGIRFRVAISTHLPR